MTPLRLVGDGGTTLADDEAWRMIAEAVDRSLKLPGLSRGGRARLAEASASCWLAPGVDVWWSPC